MLTRRGFLGALAAAVLAPRVVLSALSQPSVPRADLALILNPVLEPAHVVCTWINQQTAAPLTQKSLREAIALLEAIPPDPSLGW
jgi:hypothetical protein